MCDDGGGSGASCDQPGAGVRDDNDERCLSKLAGAAVARVSRVGRGAYVDAAKALVATISTNRLFVLLASKLTQLIVPKCC